MPDPTMTAIDCRLYSRGVSSVIPLDDVSEHITDPANFIWIELKSPDSRTIHQLGEEFGLHELALEDAISTHQRPKLEEYGEHLFIATRTMQQWEQRVEVGETHLFVGANFMIAIRHGVGSGYQRVTERLKVLRNGIKPGAPYALYLVLDLIVDHFRPVIEDMQERFQSLESLLIGGTDLGRENLERLYALKHELTVLRDATEPMEEIIQNLIRMHPEFSTKELKAYYRDVYDHALRVSVTINHLRNSASDAMQFHLALLSLKQNESVQKLAGWGALLALPTVVFSLYGMNFAWMPELKWPWAYPAVLALTALGAAGLYHRLKKRGWI
ncbi:MAG: magnesium and cobalt transport protein CorA [Thiobacillaceae bacterium]